MQNGKKDQDRKIKRKYLKNQKVNPGSPTPDQQAFQKEQRRQEEEIIKEIILQTFLKLKVTTLEIEIAYKYATQSL